VVGWQERYADGLARLDAHARSVTGQRFHALAPHEAEALLRFAPAELEPFLELAFRHAIEGTYGAPEYGGNRDLAGWRSTRWPGDHQPHAYSWAEIAEPDPDQAEATARARANAADFLGEDAP
jgi:hypothetical protein